MTKKKRCYCVMCQELPAVEYFVKYNKHYLYGRKFLIRTDHGALKYLFSLKDPQGQMDRWLEVLDTYMFDIEHRAGKRMLCQGSKQCDDAECCTCVITRAETGPYP